MKLFAGIDGGQSATTCVVADETGNIIGRARSGPCDDVGQGADSPRLYATLNEVLSGALRAAGAERAAVTVAGISGFDGVPHGAVTALPSDRILFKHDAEIAHAGAFALSEGIVVIAGTGSVAYGRDEARQTARCGGWGYLFGDEGSAFWIGRQCLSEAMRASDEGRESALAHSALEFLAEPSFERLARKFYRGEIERSHIAALAVRVLELARSGDPAANRIVRLAADALAQLARSVADRLNAPGLPVALSGGLSADKFFATELLPDAMRRSGLQLVAPRHAAEIGALLLAYEAAGVAPRELARG